jgi:hypothetical protein
LSFDGQRFQIKTQLIFDQGKNCVVQTVRSKGLSADPNLHKTEKVMDPRTIYHWFCYGGAKIPRARLEFRGFDEELVIDISGSRGRRL